MDNRVTQGGAYHTRGSVFLRVTISPRQRRAVRMPWVTEEQWAQHAPSAAPCRCAACARSRVVQELVNRYHEGGADAAMIEGLIRSAATANDDKLAAIRRAVDGFVAGRISKAPTPDARSLAKQAERWRESVASLYDKRTVVSLRHYAAHWPAFFGANVDAIDGAALSRFMACRLAKVTRKTVTKELWALRAFLTWLVEVAKIVDCMPPFPKIPRRALGVRSGRQRETIVELSREQVEALLTAIDELTALPPKGTPPPPGRPRTAERRAALPRYTLMAETGLRPETIDLLEAPLHFMRGATTLNITADIDKNRWARELPLSPRALAVLVDVCPVKGPIFGPKRWVDVFKEAVIKAGLPKETAPYDLRHACGTHGVEASGGNLTGVAYLLGHKQVTTTNRYVHSNQRAAETVLAALANSPRPSMPRVKKPAVAAVAANVAERPKSGSQVRESTRKSTRNSRSGSGGVTPVRVQVPSFAQCAESLEKSGLQDTRNRLTDEALQPPPQPRSGCTGADDPVERALVRSLDVLAQTLARAESDEERICLSREIGDVARVLQERRVRRVGVVDIASRRR